MLFITVLVLVCCLVLVGGIIFYFACDFVCFDWWQLVGWCQFLGWWCLVVWFGGFLGCLFYWFVWFVCCLLCFVDLFVVVSLMSVVFVFCGLFDG